MSFVVATFYHFFDFADFAAARQPLAAELCRLKIKGTLLLAPEGFNGTLAGTREAIDAIQVRLEGIGGAFEHKESICDRQPFARAKVRLKKEIISMGIAVEPRHTGQYVPPAEWDRLLADPGVTVIDARNAYETHLGAFESAIDPQIRTFRQLPDFVRRTLDPAQHKKIATYCTGGIRCEKFSSWLIGQGFGEVYQLKGGILKYLEEVPASAGPWQGECYVFDERVAVGFGLEPSRTASACTACGHPLTPQDRAKPEYRQGESCPYCKK